MEVVRVTMPSVAAAEEVFALLADSSSWPSWGGAGDVVIEQPGDDLGQGEVRLMKTGPLRVREEVTRVEPPQFLEYVLLSGLPVRNYRSTVSVTPSETGCTITWESSFDNRLPGSGPVNRMVFGHVLARIASRLAKAAEQKGMGNG